MTIGHRVGLHIDRNKSSVENVGMNKSNTKKYTYQGHTRKSIQSNLIGLFL